MGGIALFTVAVALAMDAFAVAVVTGLALCPLGGPQIARMSLSFGLFQALMPVIGWAAGRAIHGYIAAFDHWIAFVLLLFVGGKMIVESSRGEDGEEPAGSDPTRGWPLLMLSIATSIDALAVGLSLAMVGSSILVPAVVIGVVAAAFTAVGMRLGRRIGAYWGRHVEVLGGIVLVGIGVKIVVEHLLG